MNGLSVLGVWTAAAAVIAVVAGWGPLQDWFEAHEKLAGWAQAVGAVLAIFAAFLIGERQARSNARAAEAAESRRVRSIFAIAEAAATSAQLALNVVSDGGVVSPRFFSEYHESILNSHAQALSAVPVHELGAPAAVTAMLALREQLFFVRDSIERWQRERTEAMKSDEGLTSGFDSVRETNVRTHVKAIHRHLETMRGALFA